MRCVIVYTRVCVRMTHPPRRRRRSVNSTKMGEQEVSVAVTPNGYADAIYEEKFVMPEVTFAYCVIVCYVIAMTARVGQLAKVSDTRVEGCIEGSNPFGPIQ